MNPVARRVLFKASFLDDLAKFEKFIGRNTPAQGRLFSSRVLDFCYDVVAPFPLAYPAFRQAEIADQSVRRALFRRDYAVLYRVGDDFIKFVALYHTGQNTANMMVLE